LARWLLMADDRVDGEPLPLTHEALALRLGTRRSGVSVALGHFQARGLIEAARGVITVIDRQRLSAATNGLYPGPDVEFNPLFAIDPASAPIDPWWPGDRTASWT
jgi:hypothetical protein